jgi:hypothetical protein
MTTTKILFSVKLLDKRLMYYLNNVEDEISKLTGCDPGNNMQEFVDKELEKARELFKDTISEEDLKNGNFPNQYYRDLFEHNKVWKNVIFTLAMDFLKIFPHRRETMSIKYIGKILNLPVDLLETWFKLESIIIIKKKGGKFLDFDEALKFMIKISNKSYKLTITTRHI